MTKKLHHFHNYIFSKKYYNDTKYFSRIVKYTRCTETQHC